ncbi:MAG: Rrf2 family transcriptional regulator [Patescibacteria group bacterium]|jgi:Rrf2 family iron-sulfur cluster assembly transcriptional regulator|nr:Rrf2 family transcriptional regulator [Patescibacteria group bacterium]
MFQISAKTDYGLLIMLTLARQAGQIVPLSPLAKHLGVSSSYLSQIAKELSKAHLIKSKEGVGGGYYLAHSAKQIRILDILEALSGKMKVRCAHGEAKVCPHFRQCGLKSAWPILLDDIKSSLAKRNLASLLDNK